MRVLKSLLFTWIVLFNVNLNGQDLIFSRLNSEHNKSQEITANFDNPQIVYVCTSEESYAYHSSSVCSGLKSCKGEIIETEEDNAINGFKRVTCCLCWSDVEGNCEDDNPKYAPDVEGVFNFFELDNYVFIAYIVAGAAILSNDLYVYPTFSLYHKDISTAERGWSMGFRKNFDYSALEYGVSYLNRENYYSKTWGIHVNYIHQIFYRESPKWFKLYVGPSVNYIYEFGIGGIAGTEIRMFDRLNFGVRYEFTSQTNHIMAGLIFTYQKEYYWKK